MNTVIYLFS